MKRRGLGVLILFIGVFCSCFAEKQLIKIKNIESKAGKGSDFSVIIKFTAVENINSPWALGFYMPRTFNKMNNAHTTVNPELSMILTNDKNSKQMVKLDYVNNEEDLNYSAGYTNVLKPISAFNLEKGSEYSIKLKNSNQWAPGNFSSMPQSLFLITDFNSKNPLESKYHNISTKPEQYCIGGYNSGEIAKKINKHIKDNRENSSTVDNPADKYGVIPSPVSISENDNKFTIDKKSISIIFQNENQRKLADLLTSYLKNDFGFENVKDSLAKSVKSPVNAIVFETLDDPKAIKNNPEGYVLEVTNSMIKIKALNNAGFFYGIQTLRLLLHNFEVDDNIPGVVITDYPRFVYRGVMLDLARHFFSVDEVKKVIDCMALLKMNTLHMHLADDEGWRLDLGEGFEDLNKGSRRGFAKGSCLTPEMFIQANLDISNYKDGNKLIEKNYPSADTLYEGAYSINDIKEIIKYANSREMTVIPEIDLPGHARALVHSMPNVFINPDDASQYISVQGYFDDVVPVTTYGSSKAFTGMINKIITEISELFDNQTTLYAINKEVSVGGDEVSAGAWTKDSSADKEWTELSALEKSQLFFQKLQNKTGIVLSGWQQSVQYDDGKINPDIAAKSAVCGHVWVWNPSGDEKSGGIAQAKNLVNKGYPTVLAFADNNYFDLTYTPDIWEPGLYWAGSFVDTHAALSSAANSARVEKGLSEKKQELIKGLEGTLWSENIQNFRHLTYMAFPKMTGLSEAAWAPENITVSEEGKLNWESLIKRLGDNNEKFLGFINKKMDIYYRGYPNGISLESKCK